VEHELVGLHSSRSSVVSSRSRPRDCRSAHWQLLARRTGSLSESRAEGAADPREEYFSFTYSRERSLASRIR
jgi:hypothetical protein